MGEFEDDHESRLILVSAIDFYDRREFDTPITVIFTEDQLDGKVFGNLYSLRHIYTTLWEMFFEPIVFGEKVRNAGFSDITRPIPFVMACYVLVKLATSLLGGNIPKFSLTGSTQLEFMVLFLFPFVAVFHFEMKEVSNKFSVSFGACINGWLYVVGLLIIFVPLAIILIFIIVEYMFFPKSLLNMVAFFTLVMISSRVMLPLYGSDSMSDIAKPLFTAISCGVVVYVGGIYIQEKLSLDIFGIISGILNRASV